MSAMILNPPRTFHISAPGSKVIHDLVVVPVEIFVLAKVDHAVFGGAAGRGGGGSGDLLKV